MARWVRAELPAEGCFGTVADEVMLVRAAQADAAAFAPLNDHYYPRIYRALATGRYEQIDTRTEGDTQITSYQFTSDDGVRISGIVYPSRGSLDTRWTQRQADRWDENDLVALIYALVGEEPA
jgi:hypothetical protein